MKVMMAAMGIVLVVFLVFHLAGNGCPCTKGAGALNAYSALLRREPLLLWLARAVLLLLVGVHIAAAARLWGRDFHARPVRYRQMVPQSATIASRTMRWSGLGNRRVRPGSTSCISPPGRSGPHHSPSEVDEDPRNVVGGFHVGWLAVVYLVLHGAHRDADVGHGAWASLRSLGLSRPSPPP